MDNMVVDLYISSSLKNNTEINKLRESSSFTFIDSNEDKDIEPNNYSFLILNKESEGIYSNIQFRSENKFDVIGYFQENRNNWKDIINVINTLKNILKRPSILNYQQIRSLLQLDILIYDSIEEHIKGSSYDITLNREHFISGVKFLAEDIISIDPLDFVVVRANESANMPSNICANFDLLVSMFCRGLILSNGPQVDPGYRGRFLCLLYNSSSEKYVADSNEKFSTVVFHSLSASTDKTYTGRYQRKSSIKDYVSPYASEQVSSNISKINKLSDDLKKLSSKNQNQFEELKDSLSFKYSLNVTIVGLLIAIIGITITTIAGYNLYNINNEYGQLKVKYEKVYSDYEELKKSVDFLIHSRDIKKEFDQFKSDLGISIEKAEEKEHIYKEDLSNIEKRVQDLENNLSSKKAVSE